MKMTEKQVKFCDYYIQTGNAAESYKKAGYKVNEATARANASRLLANVSVKKYIEKRNLELSSERIADMEEVKVFWTKVMRGDFDDGVVDLRERLKASEMIAKTNGAFITKIEENDNKEIRVIMDDRLKEWAQ